MAAVWLSGGGWPRGWAEWHSGTSCLPSVYYPSASHLSIIYLLSSTYHLLSLIYHLSPSYLLFMYAYRHLIYVSIYIHIYVLSIIYLSICLSLWSLDVTLWYSILYRSLIEYKLQITLLWDHDVRQSKATSSCLSTDTKESLCIPQNAHILFLQNEWLLCCPITELPPLPDNVQSRRKPHLPRLPRITQPSPILLWALLHPETPVVFQHASSWLPGAGMGVLSG